MNNLDELKEQLQEDLMAYLMGSPLEQYALDDICWFIVDRIDSMKEQLQEDELPLKDPQLEVLRDLHK